MENLKKNNGVTLVALVVTIVVMLILAGVSINIMLGDNGLIIKAREIKENIERAEAEGQTKINSLQQENYIIDGATIINDEDAPVINNFEVTDITDTSFTVKVNVTETGSGLAKIEYSIDDGETYITPKYSQARSYTFEDLNVGFEEYKVKVKVTDVNNNSSYASKTIEKFQIGDYVNYTYDTVASGYSLLTQYSGYDSDQTIAQTTGLKWRILNINSDKSIDLISETTTNTDVYFSGALGYNNGVYLINDICAKQYSNSSKEITARNLTIEDIETKMNATGIAARNAYTNSNSGAHYGETKTYTESHSYYPNLYAQENGSGINTTTLKIDGIGRSDAYYTTPTTETYSQANTSGLTVKQDYYYLGSTQSSYFDDSNFYSMIFETDSYYWLASRYSRCDSPYAPFGLRYVNSSYLAGHGIFYSDSGTSDNPNRLRPIVPLKPNAVDMSLGKDESGAWNIK